MHIDIVDIVYLFCWIYAIFTWWLFPRILSGISRVNPPTAGRDEPPSNMFFFFWGTWSV